MNKAVKKYTCDDYRREMMLVGMRKRLVEEQMTATERAELEARIQKLVVEMGLD